MLSTVDQAQSEIIAKHDKIRISAYRALSYRSPYRVPYPLLSRLSDAGIEAQVPKVVPERLIRPACT